jgi:hypothetical protein
VNCSGCSLKRSVDPEPGAVPLAGSQDYATKMGRVEICSVEIKKPPQRAACWLGDQLELWPLSFGRLLA